MLHTAAEGGTATKGARGGLVPWIPRPKLIPERDGMYGASGDAHLRMEVSGACRGPSFVLEALCEKSVLEHADARTFIYAICPAPRGLSPSFCVSCTCFVCPLSNHGFVFLSWIRPRCVYIEYKEGESPAWASAGRERRPRARRGEREKRDGSTRV